MRLFLIFAIVLFALFGCTNEYYVEAYKSESEIHSQDEHVLRSRFTEVEFDDFFLFLEWFTYDNNTINVAPYKLFVVLEPKNSNVESVSIESVEIKSSLNNKYDIFPEVEFPVIIHSKGVSKRSSYTFEPAFDFKFKKEEVIESEIRVKILKSGETKVIRHKWLPIRVKHFAPIV